MLSLRRALPSIPTYLRHFLRSLSSAEETPFPGHHSLSSFPGDPLPKPYKITPPVKPWPKTLSSKRLVSIISRQQNLDLALQIFQFAGQFHPNFSHTYDTYLTIITRLARARQFRHVEELMTQLRQSGVKCGEIVFVTLIRNYGLAGRPNDAVRTFLRIPDFGVNRSVRSLNCLLNVLVQNKKFDWVYLLFKNSRTKFNVIPNIFTCNILVKALCKKGDVKGAIKLLDDMPGMGLIPNVVTYTTILGGYVEKRDMEGAKRIFQMILEGGWVPDATTYTVLMDGYCKVGKLIDAVKVMDEMEENGVEPNDVTYGVMIEAYCKEKKPGEAVNLLGDMLEKKYVPSSVLCCKVIDVLCNEGKVGEACELWKKLLKKNVTPDNTISSTLIHWLCKEGKIQEARKLFDEFERSSVPSVLTYNMLIAGLCEAGELCEAGRLWDDMVEKGCTPNAFTYNMLIKGFCKIGNPKEGMRILDEMFVKRCLPNESTYRILIEGLCASELDDEIMKLLSLVSDKGGKIDANSWRVILTNALANVDTKTILDGILLKNLIISPLAGSYELKSLLSRDWDSLLLYPSFWLAFTLVNSFDKGDWLSKAHKCNSKYYASPKVILVGRAMPN
ncbi:hypothetical protein Cgig2_013091 [Carnegiea gigantea]|uniref:Pentatricopeptide repeat-containing protein n=1 Tax=Carnegiea gigantea TaxID=171969 RepID=A0A9Q1QMJ6_9CARY|nr:hypothetical protein Cgig2_013091 [Carnegiea gigantea]